jgi:hypothetical protein
MKLCPRALELGSPSGTDGRWGVAIHLGRGARPRSFYVRATDRSGRVTVSADEAVAVR